MSSTGSPRGRRYNGLNAQSYAVVGAVDPRVGEHLLDVLYLYGIAAYLQPAVNLGAALHTVSISPTPTDQLWVDRTRADEARSLIVAEAAEAGTVVGSSGHPEKRPTAGITAEEDAAWRDIVASFAADDTAPPSVPPWPVSEDADESTDPRDGIAPTPLPRVTPPPTRSLFVRRSTDLPGGTTPAEPSGPDVFAPRIDDPKYDATERFVPPPPPPLPRLSAAAIGSLLLAVVGLVVLIWPALLGLGTEASATLGVLALVGGLGGMFWRLHDHRPDDDGPDDGAVV